MTKEIVSVDSLNLKELRDLMFKYGFTLSTFAARNKKGEVVITSIYPDMIISSIYQRNGLIHKKTYEYNGVITENFEVDVRA